MVKGDIMLIGAEYKLSKEMVKDMKEVFSPLEEQIHKGLSYALTKEIMLKSKVPTPSVRDGVYYWRTEFIVFTPQQYEEIRVKLNELEVYRELYPINQDLIKEI